jgi:transposase
MIRAVMPVADTARLLHRLHCLLLLAEGHSCSEVADWFDINRRTVERWVRAARTRGVDGLAEHHAGGRPQKLHGAQAQRIWLDLQGSPREYGFGDKRWTGKRLALHLERCFGLQMSVRSCQRVILRSSAAQAPEPRRRSDLILAFRQPAAQRSSRQTRPGVKKIDSTVLWLAGSGHAPDTGLCTRSGVARPPAAA